MDDNLAILLLMAFSIAGAVALVLGNRLLRSPRRAVEDASGERAEKQRLEARLAVLERIATDRGIQTAEQIDALMEREPEPERRR